jgi:spore coat protein CotH
MKFVNLILSAFVLLFLPGCSTKYDMDQMHLYNRNQVNTIFIRIDTNLLRNIMMNPKQEIIEAAQVVFDYGSQRDTLENVGFRIKGNASRENGKKSFKLDLNEFDKMQQYLGVDKINLNAFWNDPSHLRSLLVTEAMESLDIVVSRQGFTDLFINGKSLGLYHSVENVDQEFVLKHFGGPIGVLYKAAGQANLSFIGSHDSIIRQSYDLKTFKSTLNHDRLVE